MFYTLTQLKPVPVAPPEKLAAWAKDPSTFPGFTPEVVERGQLQLRHLPVVPGRVPVRLRRDRHRQRLDVPDDPARSGKTQAQADRRRGHRRAVRRRGQGAPRRPRRSLGIAGAIGAIGGFLIPITFGSPWVDRPGRSGQDRVRRLHRLLRGLPRRDLGRLPPAQVAHGQGEGLTVSTTDTHCPYCALQCAQKLRRATPPLAAEVPRDFPTNRRRLCQKGWTSAELLRRAGPDHHAAASGTARARFEPVTWDEALDDIAARVRAIQATRRHRRRRGVRRRRPDQREGLPARQVRPARAAHAEHRLQRPVLHVVGRGGRQPGARRRPRAAVPAGRPRRRATSSCCSAATSPTRCRRPSSTSAASASAAG